MAVLRELYLKNNMLSSIPPWLSNWNRFGKVKFSIDNNKLTECPSPAAIAKVHKKMTTGNPCGDCYATCPLCSTGAPECLGTSRSGDCAALLDLKEAAHTCLAQVALKDICGWDLGAHHRIACSTGRVRRVTAIYVKNCGLTSLPASIGNLTAVQTLDLNSNGLTSLPHSIRGMTALKHLYFSNNKLASLPDWLIKWLSHALIVKYRGNQPGLQLDYNKLTVCPSVDIVAKAGGKIAGNPIGGCYTTCPTCSTGKPPECLGTSRSGDCAALLDLKEAAPACLAKVALKDLCGWQGTSAGSETGFQEIACISGRVFDISMPNCGVTSLPTSIGNLTGLFRLDLSANRLTALPISIGKLRGLMSLALTDNFLTSLPESIGDLGLNTGGLPCENKSPTFRRNNCGFQRLSLDRNVLQDLPSTMSRLTKLGLFTAANNPFSRLGPELVAIIKGMLPRKNFNLAYSSEPADVRTA